MKNILLILLTLGLIAPVALKAQDATPEAAAETQPPAPDYSSGIAADEYSAPYVLEAGVHVGIFGGGINAGDIAEGRKTNVDYWWLPNIGATIRAPFGAESKIAGVLDIGMSTNGTRTRPYELYNGKTNWSGYFIERHTYFTVAPSVSLSGIMLGVGFNFPTKVERWNPDSGLDPHIVDMDLVKDMVMDLRLGGKIAAWATEVGTLYVDLSARYQFSGLYEEGGYLYGYPAKPLGDPDVDFEGTPSDVLPASVSIGISYLFNIGL
jgi:hypothetical protein